MSDEEQSPTPEDETPTPEDAESPGEDGVEPESADQAADQAADESAGEEPAGEPELDEDAAKALAAAQAAISEAMGGGDAAPESEAQEAEEPTPEEQAMLEAMQQAVNESTGAAGQVLGGDRSPGEQPTPFSAPSFTPIAPAADNAEMEMLGDVNVDVRIELGRTRMLVEDVLRLGEGAVVELEKLAGDPVDVYVNGRLVARGEVLVLNENFCVRVNEVVAPLPVGKQMD